jgi:hypothetical protein
VERNSASALATSHHPLREVHAALNRSGSTGGFAHLGRQTLHSKTKARFLGNDHWETIDINRYVLNYQDFILLELTEDVRVVASPHR